MTIKYWAAFHPNDPVNPIALFDRREDAKTFNETWLPTISCMDPGECKIRQVRISVLRTRTRKRKK